MDQGTGIGAEVGASPFQDGVTDPVISARGLQVTFASKSGPVAALKGVDLDIPRGALFVLLGPNGAGKTTLMRCITGLVRPTAGTLGVLGGREAGDRSRLARLGVLIENPGLYGRLTAHEYLTFFANFYAVPDGHSRIRALCAELGLELDGKPCGKLSQGNRQKLQLARSLLHRPELLLWDEPTDHLDPASQRDVLEYLRSYLAGSGATALVATHRLEQMESAATHFGFLAKGELRAADGSEAILGEGDGPGRARLGFARPVREGELGWLESAFAARVSAVPGDPAAVDVSAQDLRRRMPEVLRAVVERGLPLASAALRRPSLADVYRRLVEA